MAARPSVRTHFDGTVQRRLHHRLEHGRTQRALLLHVRSDLGKHIVRQGLQEQTSVHRRPFPGVPPQGEIAGVRRQPNICPQPRMRMHAGPGVVPGLRDHRGTDRVEFDVAQAGQQRSLSTRQDL